MAAPPALPSSDSTRSTSFLRHAISVPENELQRWRKTFDSSAKLVGDTKYVSDILFFLWKSLI
jgi:hypothetical protein